MHGGEESLQAGEALLAFDPEQILAVALPRPLPAAGDQRRVVRDVFLADQPEARIPISCSLIPGGTNRNSPMELRSASSSLVTGRVITTGSVNTARRPGRSTRRHSRNTRSRSGK